MGRGEARGLDRNGRRPRLGLHVGIGPKQRSECAPRVVYDRLRILEVGSLLLGGLLHPLQSGARRPAAEGGTARNQACGGDRGHHSGGDEPPASPAAPS